MLKRSALTLLALVSLSLALSAPSALCAPADGKDKALQKIQEMARAANVDKTKPRWKTALPKPTQVEFDPAHTYYVRFTTNKGPLRLRMMPDVAPMHVTSFLYLVELGFYDGLSFHRVIPGFMAQGGCPLGNGTGGPGYEFAGEFSPKARHDRPGMLSMANRGPGTDGSQFFITFTPTPFLDGKHTVFGELAEGKDTLKALEAAGTQGGQTKEPLRIEKATIEVE